MKNLLLLVCLLFAFAVNADPASTDGWPEGTFGGLGIAKLKCSKSWVSGNTPIAFWPDPKEGEEPVVFMTTCDDLLLHIKNLEDEGVEIITVEGG